MLIFIQKTAFKLTYWIQNYWFKNSQKKTHFRAIKIHIYGNITPINFCYRKTRVDCINIQSSGHKKLLLKMAIFVRIDYIGMRMDSLGKFPCVRWEYPRVF
jgi:hypothetical protein